MPSPQREILDPPLPSFVKYIFKHLAAYSDVIQPLIDASPDSLRQANKEGITPQDILYVWEEREQSASRGKVCRNFFMEAQK